jgi:hypothetical protein
MVRKDFSKLKNNQEQGHINPWLGLRQKEEWRPWLTSQYTSPGTPCCITWALNLAGYGEVNRATDCPRIHFPLFFWDLGHQQQCHSVAPSKFDIANAVLLGQLLICDLLCLEASKLGICKLTVVNLTSLFIHRVSKLEVSFPIQISLNTSGSSRTYGHGQCWHFP